jgi:predicted GTPase
MTTAEQAVGLLHRALELYHDNPRATGWLHRHLARFEEPLRLAVVGPSRSGKSTLVNALVGDDVAPMEVGGRQGLCCYRAGPEPRVSALPFSGPPWALTIHYQGRWPVVDTAGLVPEQIDRLEVDWPSRSLRDLVLIDTPAIGAGTSPQDVQATCTDADAVLFLVRRPHSDDLGALRTLHGHPIASVAPVNALVVLSRADELGAGRVDAVMSARQLARRYRREPHARELCQDVVAVAGLLASAGHTLSEDEFAALAVLAQLPRTELDNHLLSTDRFAREDSSLPLEAAWRTVLLERFGLFGIRLAATLIRRGTATAADLADELIRRSGVEELRESIAIHFTARADVLKARAALIGLEVLLRMEPRPGSGALAAELDRVLAGTREFAELRVLAALRTGRLTLPEQPHEEALRLLGDTGTGLPERLGLTPASAEIDCHRAVGDALLRWRQFLHDPALGVEERTAVGVVVRSCEAMMVELATPLAG